MPSARRQRIMKARAEKRIRKKSGQANPGGASLYARKRAWLLRHPDAEGYMRHCVPAPKPWK